LSEPSQRKLRVIAIGMDQEREREVPSIAATLHFDVALDRVSKIALAFGPSALPIMLVFGRDGRLHYDSRRVTKSAPLGAAALARIIDPLLRTSQLVLETVIRTCRLPGRVIAGPLSGRRRAWS